jgi:hypothetical protein
MTITTTEEFRAYARQILNDTPDPNPAIATDKILGELSAEECKVALWLTLPDWLRNCARTADHQIRRSEPGTEPVAPGSSAKRRLIAADWAAKLNTRLRVGESYKFLRDCTAADLTAAARIRFDLAEANRVEAERWAATAELMVSRKYATVADVKPAEFRSIWQSS